MAKSQLTKKLWLTFKTRGALSLLVLSAPLTGLSCWQKPQTIHEQKDRQLDALLDIIGNLRTSWMSQYPSQVARQNQIIGDLSELGVEQRTPSITGVVFRFRVVRIDDINGEITLETVVQKNENISRRLIYVGGFYSQNWNDLNQALEKAGHELKSDWNHLLPSQIVEVGQFYEPEKLGVKLELNGLKNWEARLLVSKVDDQNGQIEGRFLITYANVVGTLNVTISGYGT
ncbi:lipoprotein 17-related variable surface protein [Mycoplasma sp. ATU-Cv-703]|uniref:lipoprotein 17-related variable surface protein n=1 Tax=Mycoplasma sp. ATU-Cv-703 TaxID=2498595 RepID=UPI000FDED66F